ncbi:MAG TPA: glycosyltransferase family 2 protein [Anaeromyxobacter sp.]|nr:glycosyltransferase family 2 protein [Anaeromyxobacter sp.]
MTASGASAARDGAAGPELSIVMPCLNEAETLETCIRKAQAWLARAGVDGEVVVGDNGSTDGSREIAVRCGARVVDVPIRGYGAALYHATKAARGRYVVMGDADDSYDFSRLDAFLAELREGHDLVMGNRFRGGIAPGAMPWKNRWLGNPVLTGLGRLFFRSSVGDFHCGLRGFSRTAFDRLDLQTTGMEYASEMVIKAEMLGLDVTEVPTTLSPDGRSRAPHLRPWRDGWRHLRFMLLHSPTWLFLYPGLGAMALGLATMLWLLPGPRHVAGVQVDVHTLVFAAVTLLVGHQATMFAAGARMLGVRERVLPAEAVGGAWMRWLSREKSLEAGVVVGALLVLLGSGGALAAVLAWGRASFGPMTPSTLLRLVVPAAATFALGVQVMLWSFFLGLLRLPVRSHGPARADGPAGSP